MALQKYTKEWLQELCKDSYSFAEVLNKAGRKQGGGAQETLKKKIAEWNIDISHFTGQGWSKGKTADTDNRIGSRERYTLSDIFIDNSPYSRRIAKEYIIRHNLIPYECDCCGNNGEWNNQPLVLQLDHKNGKNNDHRIENLRFLCPNCHSQTENFSGKNSKNEITIEEVKTAIDDLGLMSAKEICLYLHRSDNGGNINKIKFLALQLGHEI